MMGVDTPETCRGWRSILRISCASSWFSLQQLYRNVRSTTHKIRFCLWKLLCGIKKISSSVFRDVLHRHYQRIRYVKVSYGCRYTREYTLTYGSKRSTAILAAVCTYNTNKHLSELYPYLCTEFHPNWLIKVENTMEIYLRSFCKAWFLTRQFFFSETHSLSTNCFML